MHAQSKLRYSGLVITAVSAGLGAFVPAHAQVGLGLAPMRLELHVDAGGQKSGVLDLSSDSDAAVRVSAESLDFLIDSSGSPQFSRSLASEAEYSCRNWLTLNPMDIDMANGAQAPVRFTVRVPAGTGERSYHCAAGFTTVPGPGEPTAIGLKSAVRIVAAFYVVVGNPIAQGALRRLGLRYVNDAKEGGWQAVISIENSSLMYFRPSGEIDVLDGSGQVIESASLVPMPVLPRRTQDFLLPLKLAGGAAHYTLRARIDLGGNEILEATAPVTTERVAP